MAWFGRSYSEISIEQMISHQCDQCENVPEDFIDLPCQHRICKSCIRRAKFQQTTRRHSHIWCVVCDKKSRIQNDSLPNNINIAFFLGGGHQTERQGIQRWGPPRSSRLCSLHGMPLGLYCKRCLAFLCDTGFQEHEDHRESINNITTARQICEVRNLICL